MSFHRVINVPAAQIVVGDVVLTFPSVPGTPRAFFGGGIPEREQVIEWHTDPADGTIYIKTVNASSYHEPYDHIKLDCLLTFGKNTGEKT